MDQRFKNWCRLCAKSEGCTREILVNDDDSLDLRSSIEKHFSLQIESNEPAPTTICDECYARIANLIEFEKIVQRSQLTFKACTKIDCKDEDFSSSEVDIPSLFDDNVVDANIPHITEETHFPCTHCDNSFHSENSLSEHIKFSHSVRKLSCNICGSKFAKPIILRSHQTLVHSNVRPFICEECGRTFKRSGELTRHKEFHRDDTPYACSICGKQFKSKLVATVHEKNHSVKKLTCNICGHQLKTKHTLRVHMQTHSDEKKFECIYCERKFRNKKNLSCHELTHTGLRPYSCAICNQSFAVRWNCRAHQKSFHSKELVQYEKEGLSMIISKIVKEEFSCGQRHSKKAAEEMNGII